MLEQRIQQHFIDSADLKYQAAQALGAPINAAVQALLACVTNGSKVLACGSGLSSAQALQFAMMCVAGFERERPELAAIALSADAGWAGGSAGQAFEVGALARQIRALGAAGDILLVLCVNGDEPALLEAVLAAHERDMSVIALCARDAGAMGGVMRETDVQVCVPHERAARVREVHTLILHCICDGMDTQLLGEQEML
ncbi:SIS domain-containing protein [Diaphorobacter sp.]|uniref:SIS domain-containing protein n=1 Tax=Diaphorobacter sp. TaxID=1934310 RepID=UPI0028AD35C3|nr:SIS domain-containing protein [Diaphorobacter sp.]